MKPSFKIHRSDGSVYPTLKKSFLRKEYLTGSDFLRGTILFEDGTEWKLAVEDSKVPNIGDKILYIISFQAHTYGNFAIAKAFDSTNITGKENG